jgi:hypothetical protein
MQRAIVTVKLQGSDLEYDLEVPAELSSLELADLITFNLRPDRAVHQTFAVRCLKPDAFKRPLGADESLAAAGLWDGAYLVIEPMGKEAQKAWKGIVREWVSLLPEAAVDDAPIAFSDESDSSSEWEEHSPSVIPSEPTPDNVSAAAVPFEQRPLVTWEPLLTDDGAHDEPPSSTTRSAERRPSSDDGKSKPDDGFSWKKL